MTAQQTSFGGVVAKRKNSRECPQCGGYKHRQSPRCWNCHLKHFGSRKSIKICPVCKGEFEIYLSELKHGYGKYCSVSCARSGSPVKPRSRKTLTCHVCGVSFEKQVSEIKKNVGNLHFCSSSCWYKHNQKENHAEWTGGQDARINSDGVNWRNGVLGRDRRKCQMCFSSKRLQAHHIRRFGKYPEIRWELWNGITLCYSCHVLTRNKEELYEEQFYKITGGPHE